MMQPSVIIPTLNASRYLRPLVGRLREQSHDLLEIIVIDSSSDDGTAELAASLGCRVETIDRSQFNHGATRNLGASLAESDLLVFMTQDALPCDGAFAANLTRPLRDGAASAAYGRQIPYPSASPTERFARAFNYPAVGSLRDAGDIERLGVRAFFFSNVASAVCRSAFEKSGGFPSTTIVNEDMLLCAKLLRAGHRVAYAADAVVQHSHNYTLKNQFQRYFDIGVAMHRAGPLLDNGSVGGEATRYMKDQLAYLLAERQWAWVGRSVAEATAKFVGMKLGQHERFLPGRLKPKLSMHHRFWETDQKGGRGPRPTAQKA